MRSSLNILSTQAFPLHWFHHLCSLPQTPSYPFYLIFVLLTSPVFGVDTIRLNIHYTLVGALCERFFFVSLQHETHSSYYLSRFLPHRYGRLRHRGQEAERHSKKNGAGGVCKHTESQPHDTRITDVCSRRQLHRARAIHRPT